jgi:hypothetical protein
MGHVLHMFAIGHVIYAHVHISCESGHVMYAHHVNHHMICSSTC